MAFAGLPPEFKPSVAFIALRSAILGIDSPSRHKVVKWFDLCTLSTNGSLRADAPEPQIDVVKLVKAAWLTLSAKEQHEFRIWLIKWTNHLGEISPPYEYKQTLDKMWRRVLRTDA